MLGRLPGKLTYRLEQGPAGDVLRLEGALTRGVAGELTRILGSQRGRLVLDLSAVSAMDSAGVGALITGWRRAELVLGPLSNAAERALALFRVAPEAAAP